MKKILFIQLFSLLLISTICGQDFQKGKIIIGPTVGYGLGFGFGGSGEYRISKNIGVGVEIALQSFDKTGTWYTSGYNINTGSFIEDKWSWKWKYNLFGGLIAVTYHLNDDGKFDPFVKVGLGYFNFSTEYSDNYGSSTRNFSDAAYTSGLGYTGQLGFRYYFAEATSLRVSAGYPFYVSGGVDFSL